MLAGADALSRPANPQRAKGILIIRLVEAYWAALTIAFGAVLMEAATDVLEPWPVKISPKEILRVTHLANVEEFVEKMPEGYDSVVGEPGLSLSGGQRQRISIARAIVCNTPILVLEQPTFGLDASWQQAVIEALNRLMKGKTCLVAHHLTAIRHADIIFVVKDNELMERGTHRELLKPGGEYASSTRYRLLKNPRCWSTRIMDGNPHREVERWSRYSRWYTSEQPW